MTKRFLTWLLTFLMLWSCVSPGFALETETDLGEESALIEEAGGEIEEQAAEEPVTLENGKTYSGKMLIAVNTHLDAEEWIDGYVGYSAPDNGSFTYESNAKTLSGNTLEKDLDSIGGTEVMDIHTDSDTGEVFYQTSKVFPKLPKIEQASDVTAMQAETLSAASYSVGTQRYVYSVDENYDPVKKTMECLYSGTYCTVWGNCQEDANKYRLNSTNAEKIGKEFDGKFASITASFGSYWYDADGDGKVAIVCYDIDQESKYGLGSSYTAGYFYQCDMYDTNGYINGIYQGYYDFLQNNLDCIHIDTYPTMGSGTKVMAQVSNCYSTLIHEFQHMINFSYTVEGGVGKDFPEMETFLNEGFSMAAEHLICGSSTVSSRITYFNSSSSYQAGMPLNYWNYQYEELDTLSNYSNSYLFVQYLRTRYGQKTGTDGNTLFGEVQAQRDRNNTDSMQIIANLLGTTPVQLVKDFWVAVYLKNSSGPYGFNGETWAKNIKPFTSTYTSDIYNGSARYYDLSKGSKTVAQNTMNMAFITVDTDGTVHDENASTAVTQTGNVMIAVNTNMSTDNQYSGGFSARQEDLLSESILSEMELSSEEIGEEVVGEIEASSPGEPIYQTSKVFPEMPEPQFVETPKEAFTLEAVSYKVNDKKDVNSVVDTDSGSYIKSVSMVCMYTGAHCTVWGCPGDGEAYSINTAQARQIAESFESNFAAMTASFGSYWYDADGDGKIAIFCYDIDRDSEREEIPYSYTAGYFYARDMYDSRGYINGGIYYGQDKMKNNVDCIHVDTYPGMCTYHYDDDKEEYWITTMDAVEDCYSTLIHEFQHMINFSYSVKGGTESSWYPGMETFLNEGFSMAAEHMICGSSSVSNRISYFNNSDKYDSGNPLTYWNGTLSSYSNSYLFAQYLRTRYGQRTGTSGNTLFSKVQSLRNANNTDTMEIIADLLDTTPFQLIKDFWIAVYLKDDSGPYGFSGEAWADVIDPVFSTSGKWVYNGSARYYDLSEGDTTVASSANVVFITIDESGAVQDGEEPTADKVSVSRTGANAATVKLLPSQSGSVKYLVGAPGQTLTEKNLSSTQAVTAGTQAELTVSVSGTQGSPLTLYYMMIGDGESSQVQYASVPTWLTIASSVRGSVTVLNGKMSLTSGTAVPVGTELTVSAKAANSNYSLKEITVDGVAFTGSKLTVTGDHTIAAAFNSNIPYAVTVASPLKTAIAMKAYAKGGTAVLYDLTSKSGSFTITGPDAGTYRLVITQDGSFSREVEITIEEGDTAYVSAIVLAQPGNLNGASDSGGAVSVEDMDCLYQYLSSGTIIGNLSADEDYFLQVANVNGDDEVNILDYQALYEMILEQNKVK